MFHGQLRLGHRSVGGQNKRFKEHIKSSLKKCNIPGDLSVPFECHTLTFNTIELQLSDADISMLQCSAQFRILFINAHFVADNTSHAFASSATVKPTFNAEAEVIVIHNGWTQKKKIHVCICIHICLHICIWMYMYMCVHKYFIFKIDILTFFPNT